VKTVSFDLCSDIHLDFFTHDFPRYNLDGVNIEDKEAFLKLFRSWEPKSKNLIIAGDLGHHNYQIINCLKWLREEIYETVCVVTGNHDLWTIYLPTYVSSKDRVNDLAANIKELDGVYLLDGSYELIDDAVVAGSMGWYDGSYTPMEKIATHEGLQALWLYSMNEHKYMSIKVFDQLAELEHRKLEMVHKVADIMVSHINPSNKKKHQDKEFREELTTAFYNFNGEDLLRGTTAQYWVYGHTHKYMTYKPITGKNLTCVCNPKGYPWQNLDYKLKKVNVKVS